MIENSLTLPWDIAIATALAASLAIAFTAHRWCKTGKKKPLFMRIGVLCTGSFALASFLVLAYGSFIEPRIITVTTVRLPFGTQESIRMAVISDLHVGPYKGAGFIRRVVSRINALQPDLVLIAGDLVLTEEITADGLDALEPLEDLHSLLGAYAILGNHDHGVYRGNIRTEGSRDHSDILMERLTAMGVHVLRNTSTQIHSGENTFAIAGIDDAMSGTADIVSTLRDVPDNLPTIMISHNPDVILDPASLNADIIVAGHTHGGQIRLPWYGAVPTLPTHLGKKFDQGIFQLGNGAILAITRGVGESGPRTRLLAPPEILLIETVPTEPTASI